MSRSSQGPGHSGIYQWRNIVCKYAQIIEEMTVNIKVFCGMTMTTTHPGDDNNSTFLRTAKLKKKQIFIIYQRLLLKVSLVVLLIFYSELQITFAFKQI